ncbi:MAG: hypothetical protein JXR13_15075 [Thalassovita sp.]
MADGDTYSDIGIKMKVALGKPATEDQAGYAAMAWDNLEGVLSMPERGDTSEDGSEALLATGRAEHHSGPVDGGVLEIPIKHIEGDVGQAAVQAEVGTNETLSFQEVDPDNEGHFWFGRVLSMRRRASTPSSSKGFVLRVGVNSGRFTGVVA